MKKSELRQIIREELLREASASEIKDFINSEIHNVKNANDMKKLIIDASNGNDELAMRLVLNLADNSVYGALYKSLQKELKRYDEIV